MNGELITHGGNALQRVSDLEPQSESAALMQALTQVASNPSFDADKLSKMLEVVRQMKKDEAEAEFNNALARLQPKLPRIKKTRRIEVKGTLRSKFAAYEDIFAQIGPLLDEEGFSISHTAEDAPKGIKITCWLKHRLGHKEASAFTLPFDKSDFRSDVQSWGSTLQFGKRYTLCMALNIVTVGEDDDGQASGFIGENEVNKLIDLCAGCDEFKPAGDPDTTESQVLRKYKIKSLSDLQMKRYPEICNALMDRHSQLRKGAPWKGARA